MIGAMCGDIIGSRFEWNNIKTKNFELFNSNSRFTDDTVLTAATMETLIYGGSYNTMYKKWYKKYPDAGYGSKFRAWAESDISEPYGSFGNGSAMRISPVGIWAKNIEEALQISKQSAEASHNHPEGIKGAQAIASSVFYAKSGKDKPFIKEYIEKTFGYDLNESIGIIRRWYKFDVSCQGSVPEAIICFLESESFEDTVRNAISIGGDSDTIACMAGGIAEAYYGIPDNLKIETLNRLPEDIKLIINTFYDKLA